MPSFGQRYPKELWAGHLRLSHRRPPLKLTLESGGISTIGTDYSNRSMWHDMLYRARSVTGRLSTGKSSPPNAWYNLP